MKHYYYICKKNTEIIEGLIEANNFKEASEKLENKNLVVLELKLKENQSNNHIRLNQTLEEFSFDDRKIFFSAFNRQYKSGIPFIEVFNNIMSASSSNNVKTFCFNVLKKLQKGLSIDEIIGGYSKYIGNTEASLIIAGENSGKLEQILSNIVENILLEEKLKKKILSKVTYPLILFGLLILACLIFAFFVFPAFSARIEGETINIVNLAFSALVKITITILVLFVLVFLKLKDKCFLFNIKNWFIKRKPIKDIVENYYLSSFFTTLYLANDAGIPLANSIKLSNEIVKVLYLQTRINKAQAMIEKGSNIETAFSVADVLSEYAISQISTGEKAGELTKSFKDIADDYKNKCISKIEILLKFIEPSLLVIAGIFVVIIASKLISKYYETLFSLL